MYTLRFFVGSAVCIFGICFGFGVFENLFPSITKEAIAESQKFSQTKKFTLIKQLAKIRIQNDQILKKKYQGRDVPSLDDLPEIVLLGLPEGTIISIVESYWMMKAMTTKSDKEILEAIEHYRKTLFPESGRMPSPLTLSSYIKYRLNVEHSHGVPISNEFIEDCIKKANEAYR